MISWRYLLGPLRYLLPLLLCALGGSWLAPVVGYGAYGIGTVFAFALGPLPALLYHFLFGLYFLVIADWQFLAGLSLVFVYLLPAPRIALPRWVYYASYPGHLAAIAGIKKFIFPLFLY